MGSFDYVIQRGDNLTQIAKAHNTTVKNLLELNPELKSHPNSIMTGATLKIGTTENPQEIDMNVTGFTIEHQEEQSEINPDLNQIVEPKRDSKFGNVLSGFAGAAGFYALEKGMPYAVKGAKTAKDAVKTGYGKAKAQAGNLLKKGQAKITQGAEKAQAMARLAKIKAKSGIQTLSNLTKNKLAKIKSNIIDAKNTTVKKASDLASKAKNEINTLQKNVNQGFNVTKKNQSKLDKARNGFKRNINSMKKSAGKAAEHVQKAVHLSGGARARSLDSAGRDLSAAASKAKAAAQSGANVLKQGNTVAKTVGALKVAGKVAKPLAAAVSGYEIYTAYKEGGTKAAAKQTAVTAASIGGAWAGAKGGAAAGAAIGSVAGPVGTAAGAFIGGLAGGIAGWFAGEKVSKAVVRR